MYFSELEINSFKFNGTIDMYVIKSIQSILNKGKEKRDKETIPVVLMNILNLDMNYVIPFIALTVSRGNIDIENTFYNSFLSNETDDLSKIKNTEGIYLYLNNLFDKCMPSSNKKSNSEYDEEEEILMVPDWDFPDMEYT